MTALAAWLTAAAGAGVVVAAVWSLVSRSPRPDWGCVGCGADFADVLVEAKGGYGAEGYCWQCIDTWPEDAPQPPEPYTVFRGRERGDDR